MSVKQNHCHAARVVLKWPLPPLTLALDETMQHVC